MAVIKIYQRYAGSKMRSVLLFCALFVPISVMAGSKVSELPADDTIGGAEAFHVADAGADKRVTIDQVYNYIRSLFGTVVDSDTEDFEPADSTILKDADIGVSVQPYGPQLTTWASVTPGTGVATALAQTANAGTGVVTADNVGLLATGTAAPSTTPSNVGDLFIDTSGDDLYFSTGTSSSADWIRANGGTGSMVYPGAGVAVSTGSAWDTSISAATLPRLIASSTATLGTSAIASEECASVVTVSASGVATTDVVSWGWNTRPSQITGYGTTTGGALRIDAYPTSNNVNFEVCNMTAGSITPGAVTLNWQVVR